MLLVYIIEVHSTRRALYLRLIGLKEINSKKETDSTNKFAGLRQQIRQTASYSSKALKVY